MVTKCDSIWVWVVVAVGLIACQPQSDRHLQDASRPQNQTTTHKTVAASPTDQQENHISVVLEWEHLQPQTITAPDDGKLEQLLVQNGQQIVAGQLLAQFKPSQHRNTTKHTSTSTVNQAAKQQAYQKWQQDKKLFAQGFVSAAAVAKSEAAYRAASQPQTTVIQTQTSNNNPSTATWIQAPFNGVIKPLAVSAGSNVKNGQKLFTIEPQQSSRLKLLVAQENNQTLKIGQRLKISAPSQADIWLQISELPLGNDKQYTTAYAIWPTDLPKPDLGTVTATLVTRAVTSPDFKPTL